MNQELLFVTAADVASASSRHDCRLDGLKMLQVLSGWKFVMLDPKQRQTRACQHRDSLQIHRPPFHPKMF